MDLRQAVGLALQVSIFLAVFGVGLQSTRDDLLSLLRHSGKLARALLAMFVVMPVVAILLSVVFEFRPPVEIALVALAISPMPPLLINRQAQAGGRVSYGMGLMVTAALLSIVYVPVAVYIIGRVLDLPIAMGPTALIRLVLLTVFIPLLLGMLVRTVWPAARRVARPLAIVAITGLVLSVAALLIAVLPTAMTLVGNGTLLVFVVFVVIGLAVGHALGGPSREERAVLALSTACRHPAIAIAVASANFPQETLVPAAVVLYLLINIVVSIGYIVMLRRTRAATA